MKQVRERLNPSFQWLNATQFLGAMNDNIFKLLVTFFLIRNLGQEHADRLTAIGGIIFALPFLLFIPYAGILADRHSKRSVTLASRMAEVVVMVAAFAVFRLEWYYAAFGVLFLMSAQSAFFGPSKYGIIPELVESHQLSRANSFLVSLTYLSIIAGTVGGPYLTDTIVGTTLEDSSGALFSMAVLVCVAVAAGGVWTASRIEKTPAAGSRATASWLVYRDVLNTFRAIRHDRYLVLATIAAAYFSLVGAFMQMNLIPYAIEGMGLTDTQGGYLFIYAALGIGAGSLLAGRLSGRNIEFGIVPVGAMLLSLTMILLYVLPVSIPLTSVCMFLAGMGAGMYLIPIEAFIQFRAPDTSRGEVLAASAFLSWLGVLGAGILIFALSFIPGWKAAYTFLVLGLITFGCTVWTLKVLPDFFVRFVAVVITRTIYRIRHRGTENLPHEGGALLVSNHVSYMDAGQILACQHRRIRFMMDRKIYETHPLRRLFRLMNVIPISMSDSPKKIVASLNEARRVLDEGYMVCIFAEGGLTRNGLMRGFKAGFERVVKDTNYPIIPVYIGGTWGSVFSHYYDTRPAMRQVRLRYPVSIRFGKPMPAASKAWQVRRAVMELSAESFDDRRSPRRTIGRAWVRTARRHWGCLAMTDTTGKSVTYGKALTGSLILADVIKGQTDRDERNIGILLPPTVAGALVNLACALAGRTSVNLNMTASKEAFASAVHQAGLETVVTSKKLLNAFPDLPLPGRVLLLEEVMAGVTTGRKLAALLRARTAPARCLAPRIRGEHGDIAAILFSSGTTAAPKGVMLSHHNILSNVESTAMVFKPAPGVRLCATLPLFHAFGLTAGVYLPLLTGISTHFHSNPLEGAAIGEVVRKHQCSILFSTPSFLLQYLRKMKPEDVTSLHHVVAGAEKLRPRIADAFEERFGIRPREGYGLTEMSPVVSLSLRDVKGEILDHPGTKEGSVGQPVPGVALRIVDPESGEELPPGEQGLLEVAGPNRMVGYLGRADLTEKVFRDKWYQTGDVAYIDDDGFLFITDRLLRFSKIGGEMVPHMAIEDAVHKALNAHHHLVAVTAVPCESKGEKLVLFYVRNELDEDRIREALKSSGLPNLWKPSPACWFPIDAIPLTPSGKLHLSELKEQARNRLDSHDA